MKKRLICVVLALACLLSLAACSNNGASNTKPNEETRTVVDMAGRTVTVPAKVDSYIDIWYSHQALIAMLDQCESMTATSYTRDNSFNAWFFELYPDVPSEDIEHMNAEQIAEAGIDVVFMQYSQYQDLAAQLDQLGIAAIAVDFDSYESLKQCVTMCADVLNTDYARAMAKKFNEQLDAVTADVGAKVASIPQEDRVRVLNLRNFETLRADGANTVADAWITACGGVNVLSELNLEGNQYLNAEQIFEWDPDIVFSSNVGDAAAALGNEAYKDLTCVKNGNVYDNPSGIFYWNRYSSEYLLQLHWASKIFYPELFADVDMVKIVRDYYKDFYNHEFTDAEIELILKGMPPAK